MERSTVDFIVPGEMELTSAVRSVSCNSTINNKCNGELSGKENKTSDETGSGNDGDDEEEFTGSHGTTKIGKPKTSNNQQPLVNVNDMYLHHQGAMMAPHWQQMYPRMMGPPIYRHPPPPQQQFPAAGKGDHIIRCHCCGEMQQWGSAHIGQVMSSPFPINFPRPEMLMKGANFRAPYAAPARPFFNGFIGEIVGQNGLPIRPMVPNTLPFKPQLLHHSLGRQESMNGQPQRFLSNFPISMVNGTWISGTMPNNTTLMQHRPKVEYGPFSDGEADKVNRNKLKSRSRTMDGIVYNGNGPSDNTRRPSFPLVAGSSREDNLPAPPHYVTLSRATMEAASHENRKTGIKRQSSLFEHIQYTTEDPGRGILRYDSQLKNKEGIRYNSQPQLNAVSSESNKRHSNPIGGNKKATNGWLVADKPHVQNYKPVLNDTQNKFISNYKLSVKNELKYDDYLFPDLPLPPDVKLDTPQPILKKGSFHRASFTLPAHAYFDLQSSDSQHDIQNSRSSSLDDLTLQETSPGNGQTDPKFRSNTLPTGVTQPKAITQKQEASNKSSGAVRVDLSFSDKSIRKPGSAPDLVAAKKSPIRPALRSSIENKEKQQQRRKKGPLDRAVAVSNKRVMFSGVSDNESPSESQDDLDTSAASAARSMPQPMPKLKTSNLKSNIVKTCDKKPEDDIWVLRKEQELQPQPPPPPPTQSLTSAPIDNVPVTGVVVAQPQMPACQFIQQPFRQLPTSRPAASGAKKPALPAKPDKTRPTPPPPPPRLTPVSTATKTSAVTSSSSSTEPSTSGAASAPTQPQRALNPALQNRQPFHESPDEGYHEDDGGSETL